MNYDAHVDPVLTDAGVIKSRAVAAPIFVDDGVEPSTGTHVDPIIADARIVARSEAIPIFVDAGVVQPGEEIEVIAGQ